MMAAPCCRVITASGEKEPWPVPWISPAAKAPSMYG